jgi:putative transposase
VIDDGLAARKALSDRMPDFVDRLAAAEADGEGQARAFQALRASETTGRPLGNIEFIAGLERLLGRPIARRAPGRKPGQATEQLDLL